METCLHYEWYQEGQISSFEIFNNNRDSYLYSADISGGKWEQTVPLTIEGGCYRLFVYSRSICCETWQVDSKEMEIMQCSRPETVSNLRLSTVHYGQDFLGTYSKVLVCLSRRACLFSDLICYIKTDLFCSMPSPPPPPPPQFFSCIPITI